MKRKITTTGWFWIAYLIAIVLVFLLASCATVHPSEMRFHKPLKAETHKVIKIKNCNKWNQYGFSKHTDSGTWVASSATRFVMKIWLRLMLLWIIGISNRFIFVNSRIVIIYLKNKLYIYVLLFGGVTKDIEYS